MPVGLPFWLGVSTPFIIVRLKRRGTQKGWSSIHISALNKPCLTTKWFSTSLQLGNEPLQCMSGVWHPLQTLYEVWQCHPEVAEHYPFFWCSVDWRWEQCCCCSLSKLEPLLLGSADLAKTPVNLSPSSSPGKKLASHFWSSSDSGLEPCCSPFPTLRCHWESVTSSSSGITQFPKAKLALSCF